MSFCRKNGNLLMRYGIFVCSVAILMTNIQTGNCVEKSTSVSSNAAVEITEAPKMLADRLCQRITDDADIVVAIVPFSSLDGRQTLLGTYLADKLYTEMFGCAHISGLVDRSHLQKVLSEIELNASGIIDQQKMKQLGRMISADAVLVGTLTDLGESIDASLRLIETETSSILAVSSVGIIKGERIRNLLGSGASGGTDVDADRTAALTGKPGIVGDISFASALQYPTHIEMDVDKIAIILPDDMPYHQDNSYMVIPSSAGESLWICIENSGRVTVLNGLNITSLSDINTLVLALEEAEEIIRRVYKEMPPFDIDSNAVYYSDGYGRYREVTAIRAKSFSAAEPVDWVLKIPPVDILDAEISLYSDNEKADDLEYRVGSLTLAVPDKEHITYEITDANLHPGGNIPFTTQPPGCWYLEANVKVVCGPGRNEDDKLILGGQAERIVSVDINKLSLPWRKK